MNSLALTTLLLAGSTLGYLVGVALSNAVRTFIEWLKHQ